MNRVLTLAAVAVLAAACTTTDPATGRTTRNNTASGALIGAGIGAALGCMTNTNSGEQCRKNALLGAGVGALAGAGVGRYMDQQQKALEQQLSGTGVGIQREGDFIRLIMPGDVTFSTASAQLEPNFIPVLNDVAAVLVEYPKTYVDVNGHADSRGDEAYNQQLSYNRALTVANYLAGQGVLGGRFLVNGYGESMPVASNDTDAGRAKNRRVEIMLRPYTG